MACQQFMSKAWSKGWKFNRFTMIHHPDTPYLHLLTNHGSWSNLIWIIPAVNRNRHAIPRSLQTCEGKHAAGIRPRLGWVPPQITHVTQVDLQQVSAFGGTQNRHVGNVGFLAKPQAVETRDPVMVMWVWYTIYMEISYSTNTCPRVSNV